MSSKYTVTFPHDPNKQRVGFIFEGVSLIKAGNSGVVIKDRIWGYEQTIFFFPTEETQTHVTPLLQKFVGKDEQVSVTVHGYYENGLVALSIEVYQSDNLVYANGVPLFLPPKDWVSDDD